MPTPDELNLTKLDELRHYKERLEWLHQGGGRDPEGYEWGVFRVKWNAQGQPESVLQTLTDLSDLDAEMERERSVANLGTLHTENGLP